MRFFGGHVRLPGPCTALGAWPTSSTAAGSRRSTSCPPEAKQRLSSVEVLREKVRTTTPGEDTTTTIEQVIKIKVWDKMRALELLGRHLGLWKDKVEHQADFSLLNTLRAIERREDEAK